MAEKNKPGPPTPRETFVETVRKLLAQGLAAWQKPWKAADWSPYNPFSGTVYRGLNRLMLAGSSLDDPRWLTFRQVEHLGWRVKKGSRAQTIEFWQWTEEVKALDARGQVIPDENGRPKYTTVPLSKPLVRYYKVFNGAQLQLADGSPIPQSPDRALTWQPLERAEEIVAKSGATLAHDQTDRAFYDIKADIIHLPRKESFSNAGDYYSTVLHELSHWTRHPARLERKSGIYGSRDYAREELRAEMAAWMLVTDLGIDFNPGLHASYVNDWLTMLQKNPAELSMAASEAEQIKNYLLKFSPLAQPETVPLITDEKGCPARDMIARPYAPWKESPLDTPRLLADGEFPEPSGQPPEDYDFSRELIPRQEALNRAIQNLLRPGLVSDRQLRWRTLADQLREIRSHTWSWAFGYQDFIDEGLRIAGLEMRAAAGQGAAPAGRRLEVTVYNGVLSVIQAARALEYPDFYLNPDSSEPSPPLKVVPVRRRDPREEPLLIMVLDRQIDLFCEAGEGQKASRHLVLDRHDRLLAIFMDPGHAQDFTRKLNCGSRDLLEDFKAEEKAFLWAGKIEIVREASLIRKLSEEQRRKWIARITRREQPLVKYEEVKALGPGRIFQPPEPEKTAGPAPAGPEPKPRAGPRTGNQAGPAAARISAAESLTRGTPPVSPDPSPRPLDLTSADPPDPVPADLIRPQPGFKP
jgi:antirestriction protein ArdC